MRRIIEDTIYLFGRKQAAQEAGLDPRTLHRFLDGKTVKGNTWDKLVDWAQEKERQLKSQATFSAVTYEEHDKEWEESKPAVRNVLVIPDLHAPFVHKKAFDFVKGVKDSHEITDVIFLGDVIDNHYASYHDSDPDGYGGKGELCLAIDTLKEWHDEFPNAKVCVGNHDRMAQRKAYSGKVPKAWVKEYNDVLETKTWNFDVHHEIGRFMFVHGEGQIAKSRAKDLGRHIVQGHYHSRFDASYEEGNWAIHGGCLINAGSYAMAYGKFYKRPKLGCVVIQDALSESPCIKMIKMEVK